VIFFFFGSESNATREEEMVFAALVPAPTTGPTEVAWLGGVLTKLWGAWLLSVLAGGGQWHVNFSV